MRVVSTPSPRPQTFLAYTDETASMNAETAHAGARGIMDRLGASLDGEAITYAVPCSRGYLRRSTTWTFLIVTDMPEAYVRAMLPPYDVEFLSRRKNRLVLLAWPRTEADTLNECSTLPHEHEPYHATPHTRG